MAKVGYNPERWHQGIRPGIQVANSLPLRRYYLHTSIAIQCLKTLEKAQEALNTQELFYPCDLRLRGMKNLQL